MEKLVVYYSYTGHTKMIAEKIAQKINADIEELFNGLELKNNS